MKIAIAGDFCLFHPEQTSIDGEVCDMLQEANHIIVNLEAPLSNPITDNIPLKSGVRILNPIEDKLILSQLGVDTITLANNHILDYGIEGYNATIENLQSKYTLLGCGTWEEAYQMHVFQSDEIQVGIINLCEYQFGMLADEWTQGNQAVGCAWINHPKVNEFIVDCKKQVDKLIAICHCGIENEDVPLPEWRDRYRQMIRLGCDAVIAHHPHRVQGYEIYNNSPICYSLGNFCFVGNIQMDDEWNTGAVAMLDVTKERVNISMRGVRVTNHQRTLSVFPESEWNEYLSRKNCMLEGKVYMNFVDEMCLRKMKAYDELLAMGGFFRADSKKWIKNLGRKVLKRWNPIHVLNFLQCESHRWCYSRALRLTNK